MHSRDDRAEGQLPAKPHHDVDEHHREGKDHREHTLLREILTYLRADGFEPLDLNVRSCRAQDGDNLVLRRSNRAPRLDRWQPDHDVRGRAEILHLHGLESGRFEASANRVEIGRRAVGGFDDHAAGEVDAVVHSVEDRRNGNDVRDGRTDHRDAAPFDEIEVRRAPLHKRGFAGQESSAGGGSNSRPPRRAGVYFFSSCCCSLVSCFGGPAGSSSWFSTEFMALRKLFTALPRSPPTSFSRFVPKIRTTMTRMITSCTGLIAKPIKSSPFARPGRRVPKIVFCSSRLEIANPSADFRHD